MVYACTLDRFQRDVSQHRMRVLQDDGVYRHIHFGQPNSSTYSFTITTWPGHLAISGDCGAYTFLRLHDMFDFFGDSERDPHFINPGYWGEKLEAIDKRGGFEEFSGDRFAEVVKSWLKEHEFEDVKDYENLVEVLEFDDYGKHIDKYEDAINLIENAALDASYEHFRIDEFWDYHLQDFTFRYIWCIRAIRWAIRQYRLGGDRFERQRQADLAVLKPKRAA